MNNLSEPELIDTTKAIIELGDLAMQFGRIFRTCVAHPDGTPESDTDHTVMLAWVAPGLAEIINLRVGYERYPVGKVTEYAVVHDATEVIAGDTPTIRISAAEYAEKEKRESAAADDLHRQFKGRLSWFGRTVYHYEAQVDPSAKFVRSVDKMVPKIVHVLNAAEDLRRAGITIDEFRVLYERQRAQIEAWCPEPILLQIYDELCGEVGRCYQAVFAVPQPAHEFVVFESKSRGKYATALRHLSDCEYWDMNECPFSLAYKKFLKGGPQTLNPGVYPIELTDDGLLNFVGKQD